MTESKNSKLADIIAQRVMTHFDTLRLEFISGLEVMLPKACSDGELEKWNVDILTPCLDSFVTQTGGRPDIDVVFIAEDTIPEAGERIIERAIVRLVESYPLKDFTFKLWWNDHPKRISRLEGVDEYKICIEKETDLDIEGLELVLSDLCITMGIHRGNIEKIPSLAQAVVAKGCRKMSSRLLRLSEWEPEDSASYLDMLQKLYETYESGDWWFYLFDQFLLDAKYQGAYWGCGAGKARACLLPNGIQIPCFRFLENPELIETCTIGDASKPFLNANGRCLFNNQSAPGRECISCEINTLCYGGCYMDRYKGNGTQFGRNELFCELLINQIHFLKNKRNSLQRDNASVSE